MVFKGLRKDLAQPSLLQEHCPDITSSPAPSFKHTAVVFHQPFGMPRNSSMCLPFLCPNSLRIHGTANILPTFIRCTLRNRRGPHTPCGVEKITKVVPGTQIAHTHTHTEGRKDEYLISVVAGEIFDKIKKET